LIVLDANVLIYAYNEDAPARAPSRRWLGRALFGPEPTLLPWATIHAFLRIMSHPHVLPRPLSLTTALSIADQWLARPNVAAVEPGARYWQILRELVASGQARGNLIMDAHLAALAIENGAALCTTDRDFTRFKGLRLINPLA
jgi:toxin-antitoxin system PIN domain toxin